MGRRRQLRRKEKLITTTGCIVKESVVSKVHALQGMMRSRHFRFAATFTLSCIGLYTLIHFLPTVCTTPINEHTASTLGLLLNTLGIPAATIRDTVVEGGLAFMIIPECTPLFTASLFLSFVAFYPATLREKATGLLMGIPALYLGNLARLTATFVISRYDRRFFDVVHVYLGQVFTMLLVMLAVIVWLRCLDHKGPTRSTPVKAIGFLARFVLISGCLFLVWIKIHHWYIRLVDQFMVFGFSLLDWRLIIPRNIGIYYETFNIVTFSSLVLATSRITWSKKLKGLGIGLAALFLLHLVHRIDNLLITGFSFVPAVRADYIVCAVGQYVLPILAWLVIASKFPQRS
jgi:exosortase H (IPTLxxWG-CTERM-specific)